MFCNVTAWRGASAVPEKGESGIQAILERDHEADS